MKTHRFSAVLFGVAELTPELADALYEATRGDIELTMCDGIARADFARRAGSLRDAVDSAIRQIESVPLGVRIVRVESEDANVIAKINAELIGAD